MSFVHWLATNRVAKVQVPMLRTRFRGPGDTIDECYVHEYFPSRMQPYHSNHRGTQAVLAIKGDRAPPATIAAYAEVIASIVPAGATICRVPGHLPKPTATGLDRIITLLGSMGYKARPDLIRRTKDIPSVAGGGKRDLDMQLDSMAAGSLSPGERRFVVILDDVMTSGSSMGAAYDHVETAGAERVEGLALAHTVDDYKRF